MATVQIIGFSLLQFATAIAAALIAAIALRHRSAPAGTPIVVMAVGTSLYATSTGLMPFISDPLWWRMVNNIGYPLGAAIAVGSFFVVVEFTDHSGLADSLVWLPLTGFVAFDFLIAMTDPIHAQLVTELQRKQGVIVGTAGPLFWVHTIVSLGIVFVATGICLSRFVNSTGVYRKQSKAVLAAFTIGIAGFVWQSVAPIHPALDVATLGMLGWCGIIFWGIFRVDFLDIVPVGRDRVVEVLEDPVMTISADGEIIDANPALQELIELPNTWEGDHVTEVLENHPPLRDQIESQASGRVTLDFDGTTRYFEVDISAIQQETSTTTGTVGPSDAHVVIMREVTAEVSRQQQLKDSRRRYRSLFENSPLALAEVDLSETIQRAQTIAEATDDVVAYLDAHPDEQDQLLDTIEVRDINSTAVETYDADTKQELIERFGEVFTEDGRTTHCELLAHLVAGDERFRAETTYRTLTGTIRNELLEVFVPGSDTDDYSNVIMATTDITDQKQREDDLQYRTALLESINESVDAGILVTNSECEILWYNSQFQELWDLSGDRLAAGNGDDLVDTLSSRVKDSESFKEMVTHMFEPPHEPVTDEFALADERWMECYSTPVIDDGAAADISGTDDNTDDRDVVDSGDADADSGVSASRDTNTASETQYGLLTLTRDITDRRRYQTRIELQNRMLERLASVISHDLQTPLTTAEKHLKLLEIELADPADPVAESLTDLRRTHERLRRFTEHLPKMARESTDVQAAATCDLAGVAEAAWEVVDTGSLDLEIKTTTEITADATRLQQVFENLFENVVIHGHDNSSNDQQATTVWVGTSDNGFYIADNGPGVLPEQDAEIFEYGMSTGDGSGVGLAIVRNIVEAHGWSINIEEHESGGAKFSVDTGNEAAVPPVETNVPRTSG